MGDGSMDIADYRIAESEYRDRWSNLREEMIENRCDLVFVYGDDHSFSGAGDIRYLCDYAPHIEPAVIVMSKRGDPVMVTGPECKDYALAESSIKEVFAVAEFAIPGQEYPFTDLTDFLSTVRKIIKGPVSAIKKVGVIGMKSMPSPFFVTLKELFENAVFVSADPWITRLKMIKTEKEIKIIRRAFEIAQAGMEACIKAARPGITEIEIAAEGEYVMRRMGAEGTGIDTIVGSGPNARLILPRSTGRKLEQGDRISLAIGPRFRGYHGQVGRPVILGGDVPQDLAHAMKVSAEALELTREMLKPGAVGEEVESAGRSHVKKNGLGDYYVYSSCHSVGTVEAEEPVLGPGSRLVLEPNMVFNIDIPLFLAPFGGFRFEDGFLITKEGNIKLTGLPLEPVMLR
jgi:Xaa-Pro aminopeptidase